MKKRYRLGILVVALSLVLAGCLGGGKGPVVYDISGVVADGLGIGVDDVELILEGTGVSLVAKTDAEGSWFAKGLKGTVEITPNKEGWFFNPGSAVVTKKSAEVNFTAVKGEDLTITIEGEGRVMREVVVTAMGGDYYPRTTEVQLTAEPDFDWSFHGWAGDIPEGAEQENPLMILMDEPKEITAIFVPKISVYGAFSLAHDFPQAYEQMMEWAETPTSLDGKLRAVEATADLGWATYHENEYIVRLSTALSRPEQERILTEAGYNVLDTIEVLGAHLVTSVTPTGRALALEEHRTILSNLPEVLSAEPNYHVFPQALNLPNDVHYHNYQWWNYDQIRLPQAWAITTGDSNIRVAVIDTGIETEHPDLMANIDLDSAWDFTTDGTVEDGHGHGTHVSGTIGAVTNNGMGVAGVMWDVEILPIKVFDASGMGSNWNVVQGILYAAGLLNDQEDKPTNPRPADIVNMSLGGPFTEFEQHAVREAYAQDVILVAATGNNGRAVISYPAAHEEVIAVGATASGLHLPPGFEPPMAPYSNHGTEDFLVAPGGGGNAFGLGIMDFVVSTGRGGYYGSSGTSMATPHVSGVIGLMLANGIPKSEVKEILERTAMKIHDHDSYHLGHGLINAFWAVNAVKDVRLIQGLRDGNAITVANEAIVQLGSTQNFQMFLDAGEYQLIAWIDVNGNGLVDTSDYLSETPILEFEYGQGWSWRPELWEFHSNDDLGEVVDATSRGTYTLDKR